MKFKRNTKMTRILDSLFEVYSERVPDVKKITSEMIREGMVSSQKILYVGPMDEIYTEFPSSLITTKKRRSTKKVLPKGRSGSLQWWTQSAYLYQVVLRLMAS